MWKPTKVLRMLEISKIKYTCRKITLKILLLITSPKIKAQPPHPSCHSQSQDLITDC